MRDTNQYVLLGKRRRAGKMNEYSLFAQDSWRVTPTLTLNGGLRWDVQMPFKPVNDIMSQSTFADACGVSGDRRPNGDCNFFQPTATRRQGARRSSQFDERHAAATTPTGTTSRRTSAWRGGRTCRAAACGRSSAIPSRRRCAPATRVAYERQGMGIFTGSTAPNPGSTLSLTRSDANGLLVPAGGPDLAGVVRERSRIAGVHARRRLRGLHPRRARIRSRRAQSRRQHQHLPPGHPGRVRALVDGQLPAGAVAGHGDRHALRRHARRQPVDRDQLQRRIATSSRTGSSTSSSLAMANLQANNAAGGSRAGSFAYFGPGTRHQPAADLPRLSSTGRADAEQPGRLLRRATGPTRTFAGRLVATNPHPTTRPSDLDGNADPARQRASAPGSPANFFVVNPDVDDVNVYESKAFSDYHALQIELRRRLSTRPPDQRQLPVRARGRLRVSSGRRYGRVMNPTANVRHAIKTQWD